MNQLWEETLVRNVAKGEFEENHGPTARRYS
jgi:hypothetical protein